MLAKYANISITESLEMPDFEREAYIDMLAKEMENENNLNNLK